VKILYLHQFDLNLAGGSGTYLRRISAALGDLGHTIEVVSARCPDRYGSSNYQLPFGFTLTFGPERREGERTIEDVGISALCRMAQHAATTLEREAFGQGLPDMLLVNHISLVADVALKLSRRHGIPYRVITFGTDTQLLLRDTRYLDWLAPAASHAQRVLAISRYVADQTRGVMPECVVENLGGAVDHAVFRPAAAPSAHSDRIAFVGRLVTEKGVMVLLEALRSLDANVFVDVVGEGPQRAELEAATRRYGLANRVNFLGYLPPSGVRDTLVQSAVAVTPSTWDEPLGLVVLEAMACGVPVVATAVGGIPEMIVDGHNGLLVDPGDPAGLACAIRRVLTDRSLRLSLRERGLSDTTIRSYHDVAHRAVS
jgi:glycosyltransferase involved in cell wall biosynthesis